MEYKNNESGGALLTVLLLVVFFTLLGMSLLTMNISAAKQFNKKEEQVQARHLAEMGVIHFKAEVDEAVKGYHEEDFEYVYVRDSKGINKIDEDASLKKYYKGLCEAANGVKVDLYSSDKGTYSLDKMDDASSSCVPIENQQEIELAVESIGRVAGTSKIIDEK